MIYKIIALIAALTYGVVVSQPFMYMLAFKTMQLNLGAESYLEVRKWTDKAMRANFKWILYIAVLTNIALLVHHWIDSALILFTFAAFSMLALVGEILLAVRGNVPINDVINTWSPGEIPADWAEYRDKWFRVFSYRTWLVVAGFTSLLISIILK